MPCTKKMINQTSYQVEFFIGPSDTANEVGIF